MKFCNKCSSPEFLCCDFCLKYYFMADSTGSYVDMGFCKKHNAYRDPDSEICDDFECTMTGEREQT